MSAIGGMSILELGTQASIESIPSEGEMEKLEESEAQPTKSVAAPTKTQDKQRASMSPTPPAKMKRGAT